jgi:hypothetical protein
MRVRVTTKSGSEYYFDTASAYWSRTNHVRSIVGYAAGSGTMLAIPEIVIGEPMRFPTEDDTKPEGWALVETSDVVDFEMED